jgi:deazaflavin-dependent oxidoreductase (nitroreductase family)
MPIGDGIGDYPSGSVPAMGLGTDLGYERGRQNVVQRWMASIASTRPGAALGRRILPTLDRSVLTLTRGRSTLTSLASGLPVLWLTTTGARSNEKRTVPLLGFPIGEDLAVLGTHFGSRGTPGWVHNLEAAPFAEVGYRDQRTRVRARRAGPDEEAAVWGQAASAYPGYEHYAGRAAHREIRVFILERPGSD